MPKEKENDLTKEIGLQSEQIWKANFYVSNKSLNFGLSGFGNAQVLNLVILIIRLLSTY